jgi:hypothetical protein
LRVSDGDRERCITILRRHTTEGRLTLDEFSDRVGEAYAARTYADLDQTLRELPAEMPLHAPPARRRRGGLDTQRVGRIVLAVLIISAIIHIFDFVPLLFIIGGVCLIRRARHPHHSRA